MKCAQVAVCLIFTLRQCHGARIYVDSNTQDEKLESKVEEIMIPNDIQVERLHPFPRKNTFDNHHFHTKMIRTFPLIEPEDDKVSPFYEEIQLFKRGRGGGRARRRTEAKAARAEAKANAPSQGKQQQKPAAAQQQHNPAPGPAKKGGMSKGKAALLVAGGAAAGATAVHAMSGGGGGGDPNAPPA